MEYITQAQLAARIGMATNHVRYYAGLALEKVRMRKLGNTIVYTPGECYLIAGCVAEKCYRHAKGARAAAAYFYEMMPTIAIHDPGVTVDVTDQYRTKEG